MLPCLCLRAPKVRASSILSEHALWLPPWGCSLSGVAPSLKLLPPQGCSLRRAAPSVGCSALALRLTWRRSLCNAIVLVGRCSQPPATCAPARARTGRARKNLRARLAPAPHWSAMPACSLALKAASELTSDSPTLTRSRNNDFHVLLEKVYGAARQSFRRSRTLRQERSSLESLCYVREVSERCNHSLE